MRKWRNWKTHHLEGVAPQGVWVRIPPSAPAFPARKGCPERVRERGTLMPFDLPDLPKGWCCYLLLCADGSYYCGLTGDLKQRLLDHASGRGSKYTRGTMPTALVWFEHYSSRERAARREREIKKWGRRNKELLAKNGVWVSLVRREANSG